MDFRHQTRSAFKSWWLLKRKPHKINYVLVALLNSNIYFEAVMRWRLILTRYPWSMPSEFFLCFNFCLLYLTWWITYVGLVIVDWYLQYEDVYLTRAHCLRRRIMGADANSDQMSNSVLLHDTFEVSYSGFVFVTCPHFLHFCLAMIDPQNDLYLFTVSGQVITQCFFLALGLVVLFPCRW